MSTRLRNQLSLLSKCSRLLVAICLFPSFYSEPIGAGAISESEAYTSRTEYEWWLVSWATNQIACQLVVYHLGWPYETEIEEMCGDLVYQQWIDHPVCPPAENNLNTSGCKGLYLMQRGVREVSRESLTSQISLTLDGCELSSNYTCPSIPTLNFRAEQISQGEPVYQVGVVSAGKELVFFGSSAVIQLEETSPAGEQLSFWASNSLGQRSQEISVAYRVLRSAWASEWQVDILTQQRSFSYIPLASLWGASPPEKAQPDWYSQPSHVNELLTNEPYLYLAGQLIRSGIADAANCFDGGLLPNGYASQCGLDHAIHETMSWQNRFDYEILSVAQDLNVPARLLKNIIAQESQFWPGFYEYAPNEFGLGRITESGAEVVLFWDRDFYQSICLGIYSASTCAGTYSQQSESTQAALRGTLIRAVDTSCASCEYSLNISKARKDIEILARSILANAAQVNQIIFNLSGQESGEIASFEELLKITVANYNAGAGCTAIALESLFDAAQPLTWANLSNSYTGDCRNAVEYVDGVTRDRWPSESAPVILPAEANGSPAAERFLGSDIKIPN